MSRRTEIADAAISTLATDGMRGLTHRSVDRAAGLPEGSTSYYHRTRLALLEAIVQRLVEVDAAELPAPRSQDLDALAAAMATLMHRRTTKDRYVQLARYELMLEATRRPALRPTLERADASIRGMVAGLMAAAGAPTSGDQVHDIVAIADGLLFDQIVGTGDRVLTEADLSRKIRWIVAAVATDLPPATGAMDSGQPGGPDS